MDNWVNFQSCGYGVLTFALVIIGILLNCYEGANSVSTLVSVHAQSQNSLCVGKFSLEFSFW